MENLDRLVEQGWCLANRDSPEPTAQYFAELLVQFPDDVRALFAHACALDFAGRPSDALAAYESAFAAGLEGDLLRRGLLQYGSTLRNVGRHEAAVRALQRADRQFPGHDSVKVFLALALTSAGRADEAVAELITVVLDRVDSVDLRHYEWALRRYAGALVQ